MVLQMSRSELLEVECPSCRIPQDIVIWQTIHVAESPELKEQLITGAINYFSCTACDFEGFVTAPLLYNDRKEEICVQYVPVEYCEDTDFLQRTFSQDGRMRNGQAGTTSPLPAERSPVQHPHIVFSMDELIRYVLFRDRLRQAFAETDKESR